ncbi:MAG: glycosyl hydrolase 2 galactose-binding domain-containing protein [Acutalibacteraceae bacterium]
MKKSLNGPWLFRKAGDSTWKNAEVPGCNFTDLLALGDIPDPFVSLNEKEVSWVGKCDWEYKKDVDISEEELQADEIILEFSSLDTICDVFVGNNLVGKANNCFIKQQFNIKPYLTEGKNEIRVYFYSPVNYVSDMYKKEGAPNNANGQNGIVHIRKPQYHFGWDWGPVLPLSGICSNANLIFTKGARIEYFDVRQSHENGKVEIFTDVQTKEFCGCECNFILTEPDGTQTVKSGKSVCFEIENPLLWQTYELSGKDKQPLYKIEAVLLANGKECDRKSKKIGLRTIRLNREKDEFGSKFQFELNGVPLFIKGGNYIPPDSLMTRFNSERLEQLLQSVRFSNMNMIRVWGGGYYESDEFYERCDEMGILVWQDFPFACQAYPFFKEDFLRNVKEEVAYNVKRLKHHACLALWCGNNEIEDMHMAWVQMTKYVSWTEKFFYHILEEEIRKYDKTTPYTPGSPIGNSHNKGVQSDKVGDTHLWGVWHGLRSMKYYRSRMTRFCSEFGFESLPDMKTVERFAQDKNYSLSGKEFLAHQKCANGNDKIIYYIASRFHLPQEFKDYIYLSQISQSLCISDATEHWRRNRNRCYGAIYWQLNDCWPVCSWSSIDYYGNYKALQYNARHFNAPQSVSVEDTENCVKIFAINDLTEETAAEIEYEIFDFENGTIKKAKQAVVLNPLESKMIFNIDTKDLSNRYHLKRTGLAARLIIGGEVINEKTVLFANEKNLLLPKAKITCDIQEEKDCISVTVSSDKFARFVNVQSSLSMLPFSDNFFDLLPNSSKTIKIKKDPSMTASEQMESIHVFSLCDVKKEKSILKETLKRFKVFLYPVNIANAIYHGGKSKD